MALKTFIRSVVAAAVVAAVAGFLTAKYFPEGFGTRTESAPVAANTAAPSEAPPAADVVAEGPRPADETVTSASAPSAAGDIDDAIAEQARPANSTIEVDTNMVLGKTYEATLIIERGKTGTVRITQSTPQPTAAEVPVEISSEAMAEAASPELDIARTSPDWQSLRGDKPTVWSWNIKPRDEGTAHLTFTLYQKVAVGDREHTVPVERYPRTIAVTITPMSSVEQFVQGLYSRVSEPVGFAASVTGLITFFGSLFFGRRRSVGLR